MDENCVLIECENQVMVITLNRPHVRNAINREMSLAVGAALDQLDANDDLALAILTGAGGTFSAGMDLKAFLGGEDVRPDGRGLAGICRKSPRKPVIAAVEGWALAGGCEVALACDLIVAAEGAVFGLPEVKRGLIAGDGGLLRLSRRIPSGLAMELALTGDPLTADRAHRCGLVNSLTENGRALDGARELASRVVRNAPLAVAASRDIVKSALDAPEDIGFKRQDRILSTLLGSMDAREGARAFVERRDPVWSGR